MAEERGLGQVLAATILTPPRTAVALMLGAGVLGARVLGQALSEGERVLARLTGSAQRSSERSLQAADSPESVAEGEAEPGVPGPTSADPHSLAADATADDGFA